MTSSLTPESFAKEQNRLVEDQAPCGNSHMRTKSLRSLCPERWIWAGNSTVAAEQEDSFVYHSYLLAYGTSPPSSRPDLQEHIRENCASYARLRTLAVSAYERMATSYHDVNWAPHRRKRIPLHCICHLGTRRHGMRNNRITGSRPCGRPEEKQARPVSRPEFVV